jgi:hypothetical protein
MVANSGQPILGHWYWGNFAVDLEGLQIGKQKKPALRDHDAQSIVGWTESISKGAEGIIAEGFFTGQTEAGKEAMALAQEGFPWQASVYIPPVRMQSIREGEEVTVNGYTLKGPGTVFRESLLREVTFTALGADENTSAVALAEAMRGRSGVHTETEEDEPMEFDTLSVEQLRENCPALVSAIEAESVKDAASKQAEAVKAAVEVERSRVSAILSAASAMGLDELGAKFIAEGTTQDAALSQMKDARIAELEKEKNPDVAPAPDPENHQAAAKNDHEAALAMQKADPKLSYVDALKAVSRDKAKKEAA